MISPGVAYGWRYGAVHPNDLFEGFGAIPQLSLWAATVECFFFKFSKAPTPPLAVSCRLTRETPACVTFLPGEKGDASHVCFAGKGRTPTQELGRLRARTVVLTFFSSHFLLGVLANTSFGSLSRGFFCSGLFSERTLLGAEALLGGTLPVADGVQGSSTVRPLSRALSLLMVSSLQRLSTTCFVKNFSLSCTWLLVLSWKFIRVNWRMCIVLLAFTADCSLGLGPPFFRGKASEDRSLFLLDLRELCMMFLTFVVDRSCKARWPLPSSCLSSLVLKILIEYQRDLILHRSTVRCVPVTQF